MATTTIRFRPGRLSLVARALDLGPEVMYAEIVDGRVVAVLFGVLPESTDETLYVDVSGVAPTPEVDDYFSDVCQTFSPVPPVIPAGDAAPPFTPGSPPPDPGGPDYPNPELDPEDDLPIFAPTAPVWISFQADGSAPLAVVGTGAGLEEVDEKLRTIVNLTDVCAVRLQAHVVTGDALELVLCYRNELDEFEELSPGKTGPKVDLSAAGTYAGLSTNVDPIVSGDTLLTVCVRGTGTASLGNVLARFSVTTGPGVCVELLEPVDGCSIEVTDPAEGDNFQTYTSGSDFVASRNGDLYQGGDSADYWAIDTGVVLEGQAQSLRGTFPAGETSFVRSGYYESLFPSPLSKEIAVKWVGEIEAGWVSDEQTGIAFTGAGGTVLCELSVIADSFDGATYVQLMARAGRIYLQSGSAEVDIEEDVIAMADLTGRPIQIVIHGDSPAANQFRWRFYLDDACPDTPDTLTLLTQFTETYSGNLAPSDGFTQTFWTALWATDQQAGGQNVYHHQFSYSLDPSVYGVP